MTLTELAEAINLVVNYNWQDERRDYEEQDEEGREGHIFVTLVALDNWANHRSATPASYIKENT